MLPPHFRQLFGDAALYAEPSEVAPLVHRLRRDRTEYERIRDHAIRRARERFGHEAHVERITRLIGPPATTTPPCTGTPQSPVLTAGHPSLSARPRLLLISSNGAGMGHLTRLLAYGRRAEHRLEPHVLSLSQAVGVAATLGYPHEYLPSTGATGMTPRRWHPLFTRRVIATIDRIAPEVVVFDGTWPYAGIEAVREQRPHPRWIWSRRGLWRAGRNTEQLAKARWFDAVLEPGDLAAALDQGVTRHAPAHRVGPVTLLDSDELTDRRQARITLGLPADGPLALVSLGAGNINDTSDDIGAGVAALRSLGIGACLPHAQIASTRSVPEGVHSVSAYPLSKHLRAFDLSISATGYNSFHEMLRFGLPTLFVPNLDTALDDTTARARWASEQGWAHSLDRLQVETTTPLLADLLQRGPEMAARAQAVDPGNGARAAAELLIELAREKRTA